ncbi:unnamed protein product [Brachionus calyciflorus]|uniref:Peptidase A2 domain-containing protein n=1 Tax=Brachionus calyciflorus TaxID=104777 RepID=A0A813ZHB7_9BILA|nr:unnamed protein product [Brachionus calyciflorus]
MENLEFNLKKKFVEGLYNFRLREKCREKLYKLNRQNVIFSYKQLVEFAIDKFYGFDLPTDTNSSDYASKNMRSTNFNYQNNYSSQQYSNNNNYKPNSNDNLSQTNFKPESKNEASTDSKLENNCVAAKSQNKFKGNAIFNKTFVSYLFDTGAVRTIINKKLFEQLKQDDPTIQLKPFTGPKLYSCSSKIKIFGQVVLKKCQLTSDSKLNLTNAILVVTNHKSKNDCILGTDLIERVPCFNRKINGINTTMRDISYSLEKQFFSTKNKKMHFF